MTLVGLSGHAAGAVLATEGAGGVLVSDLRDGRYYVQYVAKAAGDYELRALVNGQLLGAGAIPLTIQPGPNHYPSFLVYGPGTSGTIDAGETYYMNVIPRDEFGNNRTDDGLLAVGSFVGVGIAISNGDLLTTGVTTVNVTTVEFRFQAEDGPTYTAGTYRIRFELSMTVFAKPGT